MRHPDKSHYYYGSRSPRAAAWDGSVLTSKQFFQTDNIKPLLFTADGGLLAERAEQQHLLGKQWG